MTEEQGRTTSTNRRRMNARGVATTVVVGAVSTLLGAGLGVWGTLQVSDQQTRATIQAEDRTRRAEVYTKYRDAVFAEFEAQVTLAQSGMDHCLTKITYAGAAEPQCLVYDTSGEDGVHNAYVSAREDLLMYGSDSAVAAASGLDRAVYQADRHIVPFSAVTVHFYRHPGETDEELNAEVKDASDEYNRAERTFLTAMCKEVTTHPSRCETALSTPGG